MGGPWASFLMKGRETWGHSPSDVDEVLKTEVGLFGVGDRPDVVTVYRQHADFVWRTLQRMGVEEANLDDVSQEVFVVVHRKLLTFDGTSRMTTWLYGICLRVASSWRKRAWRKREQMMAAPPEPCSHEACFGEEYMQRQEAQRLLRDVLDRMDIDKRAVFVMYEVEELSTMEIASVLGVPMGTVHSRLHAARKQFELVLSRLQKDKKRGGGA